MKVTIEGSGEEQGSMITYKLLIELVEGQAPVVARLMTDRDGGYAEWLDPVPAEIECADEIGARWDELVEALDTIPQVEEDCTRYNEGDE